MTDPLERMWSPVAVHPHLPSVQEHYRERLDVLYGQRLAWVVQGGLSTELRDVLDVGIDALEREATWQPR